MTADVDVKEPQPPPDADGRSRSRWRGKHPPSLRTDPATVGARVELRAGVMRFQTEVFGHCSRRSGLPLVEAAPESAIRYETQVPGPLDLGPDEFLAVPIYHVFGSEELSAHAPDRGAGARAVRGHQAR